jgi:hypothetical protein
MNFKKAVAFALAIGLLSAYANVLAQVETTQSAKLWNLVGMRSTAREMPVSLKLLPDRFAQLQLDEVAMRSVLSGAPPRAIRSVTAGDGALIVPLPLPDGEIVNLRLEEAAIMEPELAARYPNIKAYHVSGNDSQAIFGSADFTEQGFHAMLTTGDGTVFIDPRIDANGARTYISYYKHDYNPGDKNRREMTCKAPDEAGGNNARHISIPASPLAGMSFAGRSGAQLTTYRLAVAATGEYTQFQGGTVSSALSAIVTSVNRVNQIYERDAAIHLQLVNNNSSVIYTNAATDPYTNDDGSAMLSQNQTNLDAAIGTNNYDIGHVFSTGGGGVATLGSPCGATMKARGVTGSDQPVGDPFDIDFVAHEVGHQFGGEHTFNGTTGSCSGSNRNAATAYEPGSGTTIMAYAGICGGDNLQNNSDSLFHGGSITQIINFITSGGGARCGARTAISNTAPTASAGSAYTIPANTPFALTGSASDDVGETLTYAWDEMDIGTSSTPTTMADDGTRPLFRSFVPSSSPTRYFPKLQSILANTSDIGERLPTTTRNLKFRLTVRDQRGGVADSDVQLAVTAAAGPFRVTAPNGGESIQSGTTATWNVANTSSAPVSCANVSISLSTDGGLSFPTTLLASTPNNGSAAVTFPTGSSTTARLKVQCASNIFFDVSDSNFSYQQTQQAAIPGAATLVSPSGTVTVSTPIYIWNAVASATNYYLWVNGAGTWYTASAAGCSSGTGRCSITGSALANGSYSWVVIANNASGNGPSSSGMSFTVSAASVPAVPGAPTLVSPSGTITVSTPTYIWNAVASATNYYLWVNGAGTWYSTSAAGCSSGTGTCSITGSALANGSYSWVVIANNANGNGPSSSSMAFTVSLTATVPAATTLVSPSATVTTSTPTYIWNAVPNATSYYLWVNGAGIWYGAGAAGCSSGTGTCSITGSALPNGSYSWVVITSNAYGNGPSSSSMSFTVGAVPGKTVLVSPSGTITTTTPTYSWNAVLNATNYFLWVNNAGTWYSASAAGCGSGTGTCSVTGGALPAGAYTWYIQTNNSYGNGLTSDGLSFTIQQGGVPAAATLISPSSTISTFTPTYLWYAVANATSYYLWVNGAGTWYTASAAGCSSGTGTCSVTGGALSNGSYTWYIQTNNSYGNGATSAGMSFAVALQGGVPATATLATPNGTIGTAAPTYSWYAVAGATNYFLWVNGAGTWYTASAAGCSTGTGTCSVSGSALANGSYTWYIIANNSFGNGPTSSGMGFTVNAVAGSFNQQFTSSPTDWGQNSGVWTWTGGQYWYTTGLAGIAATSLYSAADFSNFDYSAKLWRNGSNTLKSNSLWVRAGTAIGSDGNPLYGYRFNYSSSGEYSVWKYVNGVATAVQGWTNTSAVAKGSAFNTLRVNASGASFYFWINGTLVWNGTDASLSSGKVGVGMSRQDDATSTGDALWVDYATLDVLSARPLSISDEVSAPQQQLNQQPALGGTGDHAP